MNLQPDSNRRPNRLIHESSPYLLQHAHNPVDWYPWGREAFAAAREKKRLIFLSIGYSTCHWCHVMEKESFENDEVAEILNNHFIAIKVDKETRPDIDRLYMEFVQQTTGSGGWPMSVILTEDGTPIFGGTYFPPDGKFGRPGFKSLLLHFTKLQQENPEKIAESAINANDFFTQIRGWNFPESDLPGAEFLDQFKKNAMGLRDIHAGGFGQAPKFPQEPILTALIRFASPEGMDFSNFTLRNMVTRGLYDVIGGGFFRYCVDDTWTIPHFEKMIYNQAQILLVLALARKKSPDPLLDETFGQTIDFIEREMRHPDGGFFTAFDADSEGEEGKFYVWDQDQVNQLLAEEPAREQFISAYGINQSPNFEGHHHLVGEATPQFSKLQTEHDFFRGIKARLFRERAKRVPPFRDEKILTGWNGLMISALAQSYRFNPTGTAEQKGLAMARTAHTFLATHLTNGFILHRSCRDGKTGDPGFLDDYAYVIEGSLELYRATRENQFLDYAERLALHVTGEFWQEEEGRLTFVGRSQEQLKMDPPSFHDGALPNESAVMAMNFLQIGEWRDNSKVSTIGGTLLKKFAHQANGGFSPHFATWILPLNLRVFAPIHITLRGDGSLPGYQDLKTRVLKFFNADDKGRLFFFEESTVKETPKILLCRDQSCLEPLTAGEKFEKALTDLLSAPPR